MQKKVLLGVGGAGLLLAGWAALGMPGLGNGSHAGPAEDDPQVEASEDQGAPSLEAPSRRLNILDQNDLPTRQVSVYADTDEGIVRIKGGNGWVRLPVSKQRPTPAAALVEGRWSAVSAIPWESEEDAILRTTTASGHLRLQIGIDGLETAAEPWVEIHPLGEDGLAHAARLYLDVLSAGSFRFHGTEGELPIQDLPPSVYQLEIGHAGCPNVRLSVRIEEGQVLTMPIILQQGATLRGSVVTLRTAADAAAEGVSEVKEAGAESEAEDDELAAAPAPFRAVAGAAVALWPESSASDNWEDPLTPFRIYGTLPPRIPEQERVRTRRDGQFVLTDIPPGRYRVLTFAEGFRPMVSSQVLDLASGADLEFEPLRIQPGLPLLLHIQGEGGASIAGAEIRWQLRPPSGRPLAQQASSMRFTSDAQGACLLPGLPQGDLWLQVKHPEFAVLETTVSLQPPVAAEDGGTAPRPPLPLTLFHGRDLEGQVLDLTTGEPLEGVRLKLLPQVGSAASASGFASSYDTEAMSDAQGGFTFHSLPPDTYLLLPFHEDYASSLSGPIPVDADHATPTVLMLSPGATLEVELLNDEGFPAPQEWVLVLSEEPETFTRARTDDLGIARFHHLPAATYKVMHAESVAAATGANARLHRDYEYTSLLDLDRRRVLLGGMQVLSTLEGFLLHKGRPAPGRRIVLLADDGTRLATTDASGHYQFQDLVPGNYLFQVTGAGGPADGSFYGSALVTADEVVQRDILLPSAFLEVRVVDAGSGRPIPYLPIILRPSDGTDIVGGQIQATDEQGMVRFETLRDGQYLVCAGDAATPFYGGEGKFGAELRQVTIRAADGPNALLELRARRGATLTARVEDQQGRPLEGVHLHYQDALGNVLNQVSMQGTNARGDATLRGLPSGPGTLIARHPSLGHKRVPIDLVPGQRSKRTLRLEPGITLHAQVVDVDGRPAPGVMVRLFHAEGHPVGNLQSTQELQVARLAYLRGTAQTLGPLQPGTYRLMLHRPGEEPIEQVLTLVAGNQDVHRRLTY